AVLSLANVFDLFVHKLSRLSARRFAFPFILLRSFNGFFLLHLDSSPGTIHLHQNKTRLRAAVPLAHSYAVLSRRLGNTYTGEHFGHRACENFPNKGGRSKYEQGTAVWRWSRRWCGRDVSARPRSR